MKNIILLIAVITLAACSGKFDPRETIKDANPFKGVIEYQKKAWSKTD